MNTTVENETKTCSSLCDCEEFIKPEVNVLENSDGYVIEAEMPGVNKDGLEITLEGAQLTLVGRRTAQETSATPLFRETSRADFLRVFELDPAIDTDKITAKLEQGILTLSLPKSERVKPRVIPVTG